MQIPGIYVEIRGDSAQLKRDLTQARQIVTDSAKGMSDSLNNALSGDQIKRSTNALIKDLGTLSRSSKVTGDTFKNLGIDLGSLQKVTGTTEAQFRKLQQQMLQTQASKVQEKALRDIARAAGLTEKELRALGVQMGLSSKSVANVAGTLTKTGSSFSGLVGYITPAIAGMVAFQKVATALSQEFKAGLKAVEDYGMSIAQTTALITTFSQKSKDGDLAGAYLEANKYAKELVGTLEMIDQKTIANSKDLRAMSETFIANGVLLDVNNKKQVEGFTAVANALAIMTQGQNKDIQMRQEIRGLMDGEIRSADKLGMLLKSQIPDLEKQLIKWREQGTTLENLGKLLEGFNATTGLIENQWATVGSTMETIHDKILRGMFEPVFNDLIKIAKEFNKSLMDSQGNLTPLANGLIKLFSDAYSAAKSFFDENDKGWAKMIANATIYGQAYSLGMKAFEGAKNLVADYGSSSIQKAKADLADVEQKIAELNSGEGWRNFQLFKDPEKDNRYLQGFNEEAERLRNTIAEIENETTREKTRAGARPTAAPILATPGKEAYNSKASDMNAAATAELALQKSIEERKLAATKAGIELEKQATDNAYERGLSSYSSYLSDKQSLTEKALKADLEAKQKELASAQAMAANLVPITDKEGNSRPDKDAKAQADALNKVEDAQKAVIEAENQLTMARREGSHEMAVASEETLRTYKEIEVSLLESQGKTVEAARLQAQLDEESLARKRLIAEADAGSAEAQKALFAERLKSANYIRDTELDSLARSKEALNSIALIEGEHRKSREIQVQLLDIEIERAELAGELPEQVQLLRRQRQELERMLDPLSAISKGWEDVVKAQKDSSEMMYDLARETAANMQETFSDVFFATMKGEFDTIGDLFESLTKRMLDSFLRMLSDMLAQDLMGSIFSTGGNMSGLAGSAMSYIFGEMGSGSYTNGSGAGMGTMYGDEMGTGTNIDNTGSGGGTATTVAGLATSLALSYVKDQIWTQGVKPMATAVYDAAISGIATSSGAAGAMGAATASGSSIAAGTATPAILDAYATYGASVAAETAAATSTAMVAEGTVAGTSGTALTGSMAASAGPAAIVAMLAAWAYMDFSSQGQNDTRNKLNESRVTPTGIGMIGGLGTDGQFSKLSEEAGDALNLLSNHLGEMERISIDAASGVMVLSNNITGEGGLITGVNYSIETFDNAAGAWVRSQVDFQDLLDTMSDMGPVSEDAISTTAAYVAEMAGVPTVADELAIAFIEMQTGIYGVAGAAMSGAGTFQAAMDMMNSIGQGGLSWEGDASSGANVNFDDASIPGSAAWSQAGGYNQPAREYQGYNTDTYRDQESFGMADGGTVVPMGDDVWRGYKYGEVVLPVDTSRMLDRKLKDGSLESKPTIIHNHFYVDGKEVAHSVMPAVDKHIANRQSQGTTGGALRL